MTTFEENLQEWIVNETSFLADKSLAEVPDVSQLSTLKEGKNKKIWDFFLTQVRSKYTVLKVRRVLKLKRDQNNPEKLYPRSVHVLPNIRNEIKNAEDKQKFLKNSVSTIKKDIFSTDQALRDIRQEIDKINQKTAILHLTTLHYQEKTTLLNSLHGRFSLQLAEENYKQTTKFIPLNNEASAKKTFSANCEATNTRVKRLLEETESLVVKRFENIPGINTLNINLQKTANEVFKGVLMNDLLFNLQEQSKTFCMNMIKRLTREQKAFLLKSSISSSKRNSEKQLQELKFNYVNINFTVKKIKNDICRLLSEKGSLLMSKINPFSDDTEYETKCQLLDKIAENAGTRESISYLEQMLCDEQSKVSILKESNAADIILGEDIATIQNKFYTDFHTMCLLLNSFPSMLDYITNRITDISKFATENLSLSMSSVLREFPRELENELRYENEALWNVIKKNGVIKCMLQGTEALDQSESETFRDLVDVAPFQNLVQVCRNIKQYKDFIATSEKYDWMYDEKRLSSACEQYEKLLTELDKMEKSLNSNLVTLDDCLNYRPKIQTALEEWWEQGAQFIPDIEYDNKTLKMWIDIVNAADSIF